MPEHENAAAAGRPASSRRSATATRLGCVAALSSPVRGGNGRAKLEIAGCRGGRRQVLQFALDEAGIDGIGAHIGMRHQRRQERNIGDDAADVGFFQPAIEPVDRGIAGRRPGDHLGQHGVVMGRDRYRPRDSRHRCAGHSIAAGCARSVILPTDGMKFLCGFSA